MSKPFEIKMAVRDYECDLQGIVNNAIYQNYLEHARHEFLHEHQLDFAQLCREGIDAVVARIEINYKQSLKPGDEFIVKVQMRKQGRIRFVFDQTIFRSADNALIVDAQVTAVLTKNGRPIVPDIFDRIFSIKHD